VTEGAPVTRLMPLPRERWADDVVDALRVAFPEKVVERFLSSGSDARPLPAAIATMLHHPALAGPWLAYNNVLLWSPTLDARLRELMILRVAWRTRSEYEWAQHVKLGESCGVTRDDVEALASGKDARRWSPLEQDLLAATDQLLDRSRIDDETWQRLAERLDERQLVEVVFVVGTYTCLAMAFNSFGVALDPGLDTAGIPQVPSERVTEP
jgi:alkylhydroperoxidase family enzyme